jgi:hypothetical protein
MSTPTSETIASAARGPTRAVNEGFALMKSLPGAGRNYAARPTAA